MALLMLDGFDHYTTAELDQKAVSETGGAIVTGGRCGTQCYTNASVGSGITYGVTNTSEWGQVGIAYTPGSAFPLTTKNIIQVGNGEGDNETEAFVSAESDGSLKIWRGFNQMTGTQEGQTAAGVIQLDAYIYIEFRFRIHATLGELRLYVDGVQLLDATGLDTRQFASAPPWGTVTFILGGAGCIDDVYIMNDDGAINDTSVALGSVHVATLRPAADVAVAWTPNLGGSHANLVNEAVPDGDGTFVTTTVPGAVDLFQLPETVVASSVVHGVQTNIHARKTGAAPRRLRAVVTPGAINRFGVLEAPTSENYVVHREVHETNPDLGTAWTLAAFNATKFGVELNA
jgi:hypothetical protein